MKWQQRFTNLAQHIAGWSKDTSTQVGAVIVDSKNRILSLGFNGAPRGVADADNRDEKLRRTIHAEANAIGFAQRDLSNCTLYVTHPPCAQCAAQIIQSGIGRVVFPKASDAFIERWTDSHISALTMFDESGVEVVHV